MFESLFVSALAQAERAAPAVKAAALMHLARVADVRDHGEGVDLLERGIAVANGLEEPVRQVLLGEAFDPAGRIAPGIAIRLLRELDHHPMQRHRMLVALLRMFDAGHAEAAIAYLLTGAPDVGYPYDIVGQALGEASNERTRSALLRRAIQAGLTERRHAGRYPGELFQLFSEHWRMLPKEEATAFVREVVAETVAAPDERGQFTMQGARFSSARQHLLFTVLGPCRHLAPELADELVATYSQLARAAAQLPNGLESMYQWPPEVLAQAAQAAEAESVERARRRTERDLEEQAQNDYLSLEDEWLPVHEQLRTDFDRALAMAVDAYETDTNPRRPNTAPKVCWRSAGAFRSILYKAGIYEGTRAERHLERIPDSDLRLFAQIELAGALAGISQASYSSMGQLPDTSEMRRVTPDQLDDGAMQAAFEPRVIFEKPAVPPSYDPRIAPSGHARAAPPAGGCDADFWVLENVRLRPVLARLFDVSSIRISIPPGIEHTRYDFTLALPREETREVLLDRMRAGVERHFQIRRETREVDVRVVTAPNGVTGRERLSDYMTGGIAGFSSGSFGFSQPRSAAAMQDVTDLLVGSLMDLSAVPSSAPRRPDEEFRVARKQFLGMLAAPGILNAINQELTIAELCVVLETSLGQVFVDETGSIATYRVDVNATTPGSSEEFLALLCDELGLVVTPARRVVEILTVREP